MAEQTRRRYSSAVRRESAEVTRRRIVEAAREVMLERGYAATTTAEVAARAGVAVQTLYASCPGGKPALARIVYDTTLAGDARPIPQRDRPEVQAIIDEPDPVRKLERYAAMAAGIASRVAPVYRILRAAAAADADAGALVARAEQQRLTGSSGPADHLAALGLLRAGLTAERAGAQIFVLTGFEVFEQLTGTCGWSPQEYADWLGRVLVVTLLDPAKAIDRDRPARHR